jgi:hypothetical protein
MRLQAIRAPVPRDAGRADPELFGHGACAPVRGRLGLALRRQFHQPRHVHLGRRRAAGKVAFDAFKTKLDIALSPARNLDASDVQRQRDVLVLQAKRRQHHDARAQGQPNTREPGANQLVEHLALFVRQNNLWGDSHFESPRRSAVDHWCRVTELSALKIASLH